jgi:hypothetical protein
LYTLFVKPALISDQQKSAKHEVSMYSTVCERGHWGSLENMPNSFLTKIRKKTEDTLGEDIPVLINLNNVL